MSKPRNKRSATRSSRDTGATLRPDESQTRQEERAAIDDQIRMRAHELYLERGGKPGDNLEDWLQAEREYRERSHHQAEKASDHLEAAAGLATHTRRNVETAR